MKKRNLILISIASGMTGTLILLLIVFLSFKGRYQQLSNEQNEILPVTKTGLFSYPTLTPGTDLTMAASTSVPAVVHIKTQFMKRTYYDDFFSPFFDYFGQAVPKEYPVMGAGSGVIVSPDGYIVTNNHVINQAEVINVTLNDRREYEAKLVGRDMNTDIALLKIDAKELPFLAFGNSDSLKIGEWVLAVGNPFNLTSTVTAGIVSAKARNINLMGGGNTIESFIQTDAAVNRGNSGGALVNMNGELVGINTAIASETGYYTGYSFAVPSKIVKKVVEDLMLFGDVQRAYIGISAIEITAQFAKESNIDDVKGLYIARVEPGSGADDSGIKQGEILLEINNEEINSSARLVEIISKYRPGDKLDLKVKSGSKIRTVTVTLKDNKGTSAPTKKQETLSDISYLGGYFEPADMNELKKLKLNNGIKIVRLDNGKLKQAGIKEGFIITHIDGTSIRTTKDIKNALENKSGSVLIEGVYPNGMKAFYGFGL